MNRFSESQLNALRLAALGVSALSFSGCSSFYKTDTLAADVSPLGEEYTLDETMAGLMDLVWEQEFVTVEHRLDSLLARSPRNASFLALKAEVALMTGDTAAGLAYYHSALENASTDEAGMLWRQAVGIASPEEVEQWPNIAPEDRGRWLEAFWASRNPNLFAGINGRIVEHFERLRFARSQHELLNPWGVAFRSPQMRAMSLEPSASERRAYFLCEASTPLGNSPIESRPAAGQDGVFDTTYAALARDFRSMDSTAARVDYNLATGLSDRGVMYLRFGEPDVILAGADNTVGEEAVDQIFPIRGRPTTIRNTLGVCSRLAGSVEKWTYFGVGTIRFSRPADFEDNNTMSFATGRMLFRPMNSEQFQLTETALTEDATSELALLEFGVWTARFKESNRSNRSAIFVISSTEDLAVSLSSPSNGILNTHLGSEGVVSVVENPGEYMMLIHARADSLLGRKQRLVSFPVYREGLALSDLLLAPSWPGTTRRSGMIDRVRRNLTFHEGETPRAYLEIYGLDSRRTDETSYRVSYSLLKFNGNVAGVREGDWNEAVRFEFDRLPVAGETGVVETLDISPDHLPEGKYLLKVAVDDIHAGTRVESAPIGFEVVD